jgi:hypothetical protein
VRSAIVIKSDTERQRQADRGGESSVVRSEWLSESESQQSHSPLEGGGVASGS